MALGTQLLSVGDPRRVAWPCYKPDPQTNHALDEKQHNEGATRKVAALMEGTLSPEEQQAFLEGAIRD